MCDILWCLPKRHTSYFTFFGNRHYCSAPHSIKNLACTAPGGAARATTYKRFCGNAANVVLQQGAMDDYDREQARGAPLGLVLEHASPGARGGALEYWCAPAPGATALTPAQRLESANDLPNAVLLTRVYNNNPPRGEAADETTVGDVLERAGVRGAEAMRACQAESPLAAPALCVARTQVTEAAVADGDCGVLAAGAITMGGITEASTLACAGGILTATVADVAGATPPAAPAPCRRLDSVVVLTPEWAGLALELAAAHRARDDARAAPLTQAAWHGLAARVRERALASRGIPHALRAFAWEFFAREPAGAAAAVGLNRGGQALADSQRVLSAHALASLAADCRRVVDAGAGADARPPCAGYEAVFRDAERVVSPRLVAAPLAPAGAPEGASLTWSAESPPTPRTVAAAVARLATPSDRARLAGFIDVNLALEALFAPAHAAGRRQTRAEFSQTSSAIAYFFFAAALPTEVVLLVRAHMLAALPGLFDNEQCVARVAAERAAAPLQRGAARAAFARAALDDATILRGLDGAAVAADQHRPNRPRGTPAEEAEGYLTYWLPAAQCFHEETHLLALLWFARDAELVHRAVDLLLALPAEQAALLPAAAFDAFFDLFMRRLDTLQGARRRDTLLCAFAAANNFVDNPLVSDFFAPDVDGWVRATRAALDARVAAAGAQPHAPELARARSVDDAAEHYVGGRASALLPADAIKALIRSRSLGALPKTGKGQVQL